MKKTTALLLCLMLLTACFTGCDTDDAVTTEENNTTTVLTTSTLPAETVTEPVTEAPIVDGDVELVLDEGVKTVAYSSLKQDDQIKLTGGDILVSYFEKSKDVFYGVCKDFSERGFETYSYAEIKGSCYATLVKGAEMAHIYWIECEEELNIVYSTTAGATLPPKTPEVTTGTKTTQVTQIASTEINGMGYVVQLADGSFIIYDGGYAHRLPELWDVLKTQNGGEEGIVIRAWVLTHSHNDHYPCFSAFSDEYADKVKLETIILCPLTKTDIKNAGSGYQYFYEDVFTDAAKFTDTKICIAHTGMRFTFCDLKMEVLMSADDVYISDIPTDNDFNNTSLVTRLYNDNYKALFLGDAGDESAMRLMVYYGDYLKSDMCQIAHHGVEDFPLIAYRMIRAQILWYPCDESLYKLAGRDQDVKKALKESKYTTEVILHEERNTRPFGK